MAERLLIYVGVELWAFLPHNMRAAGLLEVQAPALFMPPTVLLQATPSNDPAINTNTVLIGLLTFAIGIVGWLLNRSIREIDDRHKAVEEKVSRLHGAVDEKMGHLVRKTEEKFDSLDNKLGKIKEEAGDLRLQMHNFQYINNNLEKQIVDMREERREIQKENKSFISSFNSLNTWIQSLQKRGYWDRPPKDEEDI